MAAGPVFITAALGMATIGQTLEEFRIAVWPTCTDTSSDRAVSQQSGRTLLTVRQYELAKLTARGLSNPQIADQLVVSQRTADRHTSNIVDKLGFASLRQIATWIPDQEISRTRRETPQPICGVTHRPVNVP